MTSMGISSMPTVNALVGSKLSLPINVPLAANPRWSGRDEPLRTVKVLSPMGLELTYKVYAKVPIIEMMRQIYHEQRTSLMEPTFSSCPVPRILTLISEDEISFDETPEKYNWENNSPIIKQADPVFNEKINNLLNIDAEKAQALFMKFDRANKLVYALSIGAKIDYNIKSYRECKEDLGDLVNRTNAALKPDLEAALKQNLQEMKSMAKCFVSCLTSYSRIVAEYDIKDPLEEISLIPPLKLIVAQYLDEDVTLTFNGPRLIQPAASAPVMSPTKTSSKIPLKKSFSAKVKDILKAIIS